MSSISGECFIVGVPNGKEILIGRNSIKSSEITEILFYPASSSINKKCDGGAEFEESTLAIIFERPPGIWGGENGANEKNVHIAITWSDDSPDSENSIKSTDILRLTLESAESASNAVEKAGALIESHGNESSSFNLLISDPNEIWILSSACKLWAAENITDCAYKRIPLDGLIVGDKIDKSIENLGDKLKDLEKWNGSDDLNFSKIFGSEPKIKSWPTDLEPIGDGTFNLREMLKLLRSSDDANNSSSISVLNPNGISCHWFTATPNPRESVYKPFVFAPQPKISPLTKLKDNEDETLLHKLHSQRKWEAVGDLLNSLESTCIDEVEQFLNSNPEPNEELDELMKDCVEAEVKFYR